MNAFRGQHRQPKIVSSGHTLVTENLVPVGRNGSGWTVWTTGLDRELWKCIRPHHLDGLGKGSSPPSDTLVNRGDARLLISTTQAHLVDANGLTTQSPERPGRQPA